MESLLLGDFKKTIIKMLKNMAKKEQWRDGEF